MVEPVLTGSWNLRHEPKAATATITVDLVASLPKRAVASIEAEAEARRFARFTTDDSAEPDVHGVAPV